MRKQTCGRADLPSKFRGCLVLASLENVRHCIKHSLVEEGIRCNSGLIVLMWFQTGWREGAQSGIPCLRTGIAFYSVGCFLRIVALCKHAVSSSGTLQLVQAPWLFARPREVRGFIQQGSVVWVYIGMAALQAQAREGSHLACPGWTRVCDTESHISNIRGEDSSVTHACRFVV